MLKYFFLIYALIAILVVGIFGFRGQQTTQRPIEIFPDMDRQDKILGQATSDFFKDGLGSQKPVAGTVPHSADNGEFSLEFGEGKHGYYYTGELEGAYGNGMPEELELTSDNSEAFLRRGQERYGIYCAICHGDDGGGKGVVGVHMGNANVAVANIANGFKQTEYPDGELYKTITHGKGLMGGYGANIPVRDRWAIIAYVRAMQSAN